MGWFGGWFGGGSAHSKNDFELVIRAAKELEWLLDTHFEAQGQGLHQKISSVPSLPPALVKEMRYLATIRNNLVHERDFNQIPDRSKFIQNFERSAEELKKLIALRAKGKSYVSNCVVC